jgi:beta-phosphoglucomutase-like phosphatase (HAD superfamily)
LSNQPHKFKDRDIKRVVKAARAAGMDVVRVEVNPNTGQIAAVARQPGEEVANPWDEELARMQHDAV